MWGGTGRRCCRGDSAEAGREGIDCLGQINRAGDLEEGRLSRVAGEVDAWRLVGETGYRGDPAGWWPVSGWLSRVAGEVDVGQSTP